MSEWKFLKPWRRSDVDLHDYWERDGRVYKVVGIADSPTVEIRDVLTGKVENYVIESPLFAEFKRLRPESPETS